MTHHAAPAGRSPERRNGVWIPGAVPPGGLPRTARRLPRILLPAAVVLFAWFAIFGIPLLAASASSSTPPARVLLVWLPGGASAASVAAALRPYRATQPEHLIIASAGAESWACAAPATIQPSIGPSPGGPARNQAAAARPSYCQLLRRISRHPVVVDDAVAVSQNEAATSAASHSDAGARALLRSLYGPRARVTGGPAVFAAAVPGTAHLGIGHGLIAEALLALVASAASVLLYRRFRGVRRPAGGEKMPVSMFEDPPVRVREPQKGLVQAANSGPPPDGPDGSGPAPEIWEPPAPDDWALDFPLITERGSQASRLPWRLPSEPAPSAIAADSVRLGDLEVRAASLVGPSHRCQEPATPRQDDYRLGMDTARRYLLVAVSDGMSDSVHSDVGASIAARTLVSRLRSALDAGVEPARLDAPGLFQAAAHQMLAVARQRGLAPEAVRAAALAAVIPVSADASGSRHVWVAGIADVSAWVRLDRSWEQIAGGAKGGLEPNAVAEYLPYHPDQATSQLVRLMTGDVLALTTDGVADAFAVTRGAAAWFADRWRTPPPIASFLVEVGYEARTQLDDRTAVLVWCGQAMPDGESPAPEPSRSLR